MSNKVRVFIEIERGSNVKYEFNHEKNILEIDRILPEKYAYPYAYGFIPDTLAADEDNLDALIIENSSDSVKNNMYYDAYIMGALRMEDEHGHDDKILCTLNESNNVSSDCLAVIEKFFAEYKSECPNKWSRTYGFMDQAEAVALYEATKLF